MSRLKPNEPPSAPCTRRRRVLRRFHVLRVGVSSGTRQDRRARNPRRSCRASTPTGTPFSTTGT
jgi:hypothetical protein